MRKALIPAFLLVLVAVVLGSTVFREQLASAATPFTNVIVGNTSTNPVPVTQQGTASVNVTNSSIPVTVQNTPPAEEPYNVQVGCSLSSSESCSDSSTTVPAGKRLVIQTISATGFTDPGITITDFRLSSHVGGATAEDNLLGTQTETNLISKWSVSVADARAVTIYADPGTKLEIFAQASGVSTSFNAAFASLYISGYLVPAN